MAESKITAVLKDMQFTFSTGSGVFSKSGIDKGTQILIQFAQVPEQGALLDLGCGYGPVGIVMKKIHPDLEVVCSDINERAVFLAKKNAASNRVEVKTRQSDGFEKIKGMFDCILLNPPQTAGKKICQKLMADSFEHLSKGGTLQIVARHNKGGKALSEFMQDVFGNMAVVKIKSGYRVYISKKEEE